LHLLHDFHAARPLLSGQSALQRLSQGFGIRQNLVDLTSPFGGWMNQARAAVGRILLSSHKPFFFQSVELARDRRLVTQHDLGELSPPEWLTKLANNMVNATAQNYTLTVARELRESTKQAAALEKSN